MRTGIEQAPQQHRIEVLVHADAATVRERLGGWGTVEDTGHGRCVLQLNTDSLDWPLLVLARTAADFEVRSPPELVVHLRAVTGRFDRAVGPSEGT